MFYENYDTKLLTFCFENNCKANLQKEFYFNAVIIFKRYGKKQMEMEGVDNPSVADKNRSLKNAVKLEGMNDV